MNEARLRWQCRRGMRELDVMLTRYLMDDYPRASERQKAAFEALLALSDPELVAYLLKGERAADPDLEELLATLRG
jgi:antitoxin CptB